MTIFYPDDNMIYDKIINQHHDYGEKLFNTTKVVIIYILILIRRN